MSLFVYIIMLIAGIVILARGHGKGHPIQYDFDGLPNLLGACSVAAASHANLPNIIPLIQNKTYLGQGILALFIFITLLYIVISLLVIFTFENSAIQSIVVLNFADCSVIPIMVFIYLLGLYTTFKVSAVFPLNAVTLTENLFVIFSHVPYARNSVVHKVVFPLLTLIPPIAVAFATNNIEMIVGITGSYTMMVIQYIITPVLVHFSRKDVDEKFGKDIQIKHASPFQHKFWIIITLIYAVLALTAVTILYIMNKH
ncbi:transmembrane protein 104-like [Ambystoma mexicanum]|uniref:transmembrane protein 104-like n=1 Tax=Ambystoma mexicanum TaxID=8296 RepID=UPI0037E836B6